MLNFYILIVEFFIFYSPDIRGILRVQTYSAFKIKTNCDKIKCNFAPYVVRYTYSTLGWQTQMQKGLLNKISRNLSSTIWLSLCFSDTYRQCVAKKMVNLEERTKKKLLNFMQCDDEYFLLFMCEKVVLRRAH